MVKVVRLKWVWIALAVLFLLFAINRGVSSKDEASTVGESQEFRGKVLEVIHPKSDEGVDILRLKLQDGERVMTVDFEASLVQSLRGAHFAAGDEVYGIGIRLKGESNSYLAQKVQKKKE